MSKNIVLCSDGTGNSAGKRGEGTNVWKLFRAVDVHRRNSEKRLQMSFYDDGVGSGGMKILKMLGGAFGMGLNRNIRDLYSFLVQHYDPGDRIFLFGFSRGAFTVRALAGFVHTCGIIDRNRPMPFPWRWWHWLLPWRWGRKGTAWSLEERIRKAFSIYRDAHRSGASGSARGTELTSERSRAFRDQQSVEIPEDLRGAGCGGAHQIPIECLGLWDTVDAVGLPVDELTQALDKILRFSFYRHGLLPCVQRGFHALAIDDQRHTFHPVLWDESKIQPHQEIEQVWFAGMHSNVGGGYPKDQMALVTLDWMMRKVGYDATDNPRGLHFRPGLAEEWCQEANVNGKLYDSRSGLSAYYRYRPRDIDELAREYQKLPAGQLPKVHVSVVERIRNATDDYAPVNLPREFEVVDLRGPTTGDGDCDGPTPPASQPWWEHVGATVRARENGWRAFDVAWDVIWLRRLLYFAFVALTGFLVWRLMTLPSAEEVGAEVPWGVASPLFEVARWAAPAAAEGSVLALRDNPFWLLLVLAIGATLLVIRSRLLLRTREAGSAAWRHFYGLGTRLPRANLLEKLVRGIRKSPLTRLSRWFSRTVMPWLVLGALGVGVVWLGYRLTQPPAPPPAPDTACGRGSVARTLEVGGERSSRFETGCPAHATDALLEAGARYSIAVTIDPQVDEEWCDASFAAGPAGLREPAGDSECGDGPGAAKSPSEAGIFRWGRFLKRAPHSGWYVLLGEIGAGGGQRFEIAEGVAEYRATATGPLRLYVNDAICYVCPSGPWWFYDNNEGSATVTVRRLD